MYPIESVLAIGEIKKTLRKNDLIEFGKKIKYLKIDMKRKLIPNSVFGDEISDDTSLFDIVNMSTDKKFKNPLFSFVFAVDEEEIDKLKFDDSNKYMPNSVYILNYGYILYGSIENKKIKLKIEDEEPEMNSWLDIKKNGASCLASMFNQLIDHLNSCQIEPFSISNYIASEEEFNIYGRNLKEISTKKQ